MAIQSSAYRDWAERLRPAWMTIFPIAWTGVRLVLRRKLFWLLLGLALVNFLFLFATIYLKFQISVENPMIGRFVDRVLSGATGDGMTYLAFMFGQGTVTMLLLALAGELLVGSDYYEGGLTFYLSRRIGRRHYVVGKLLAIAILVSMTTTIPALILYAQYGLLSESLTYIHFHFTGPYAPVSVRELFCPGGEQGKNPMIRKVEGVIPRNRELNESIYIFETEIIIDLYVNRGIEHSFRGFYTRSDAE